MSRRNSTVQDHTMMVSQIHRFSDDPYCGRFKILDGPVMQKLEQMPKMTGNSIGTIEIDLGKTPLGIAYEDGQKVVFEEKFTLTPKCPPEVGRGGYGISGRCTVPSGHTHQVAGFYYPKEKSGWLEILQYS